MSESYTGVYTNDPIQFGDDAAWSVKKTWEDAGQYATWTDLEDGIDAYVELVDASKPSKSMYQKTDPETKEPIYEKNQDGSMKLDEDGNLIPVYPIQSEVQFQVMDLIDYDGDPTPFIGQKIRSWISWVWNDGKSGKSKNPSNLYTMSKAMFGPMVEEPEWQPHRKYLLGGKCKVTIKVGEPKGERGIRYPRVTNFRPARNITDRRVAPVSTDTDEVPF